MMETELGSIACNGEEATVWVSGRLRKAALRVYRSFDLRSARAASSGCVCPHHGTEACDCQMVVLLIYQGQGAPATVVLHGHEGRTWIMLAAAPDRELEAAVVDALATSCTAGEEIPQGQAWQE